MFEDKDFLGLALVELSDSYRQWLFNRKYDPILERIGTLAEFWTQNTMEQSKANLGVHKMDFIYIPPISTVGCSDISLRRIIVVLTGTESVKQTKRNVGLFQEIKSNIFTIYP